MESDREVQVGCGTAQSDDVPRTIYFRIVIVSEERTIKAGQIVQDIRRGMTDSELMEKYRLSARGLQSLFRQVLEAKILQPYELYGRSPSYDHSVGLENLRAIPRHVVYLPLPVYERGHPEISGTILDVSENGLKIRDILTSAGEVKELVIPSDVLSMFESVEFKAVCRWTSSDPTGGASFAGFEVQNVLKGDIAQLIESVQALTFQDNRPSGFDPLKDEEDITESVDLANIFKEEVSSSGSFSFHGVTQTWFGQLLQSLPIHALLIDPAHKITFANRSWACISRNYDKIMGRRLTSLFPDSSDVENIAAVADRVFRTRRQQSMQAVIELNGKRIWGRLHFCSIRMGMTRCVMVLVQDLTAERERLILKEEHNQRLLGEIAERKVVEDALRSSETKYRTLFDESRDAVYLAEPDGTIVEANESFLLLVGRTAGEIAGTNVCDLHLDPHVRERFRQEIEKQGSVKDYEIRLKTKEGTIIQCLETATLRRNEDGSIIGYQAIIRDVTEHRRLEQQLLHAQKMEALGTLAGGMAHDVNNVLQVILGFTDLLLTQKTPDDPDYEKLRAVFKASKNGRDLVQRILTFSRKVESDFRLVDLNHELKQAESLLNRTVPKMIEIRLHLDPDLKTISADPGQIEQIILNLAINARDAMPDGGTFTIKTANAILDTESVGNLPSAPLGECVLLSVSDTGHGMDQDVLGRIFEPFYTTKKMGEGTGLGLAMVFGIVKGHRGHICCRSDPGEGTCFDLFFPVSESAPESRPVDSPTGPFEGNETILLVDDDDLVRELGREMLNSVGYSVIVAKSGEEALELYGKGMGSIALVILDLIMPGMGGKQCFDTLLKIDPNAKVIIASGYPIEGAEREAFGSMAVGVVNKPFNIRKMLQTVREALDKPIEHC